MGLLTALVAEWSVGHENLRRGRTEETLRDSEEKYRMLVDGVQDYAIFMLDLRGQIVSWGGGAEKVKGLQSRRDHRAQLFLFLFSRRDQGGKTAGTAQVGGPNRPA